MENTCVLTILNINSLLTQRNIEFYSFNISKDLFIALGYFYFPINKPKLMIPGPNQLKASISFTPMA